ncbi:MAG: phage Gp37/Gp68 family protein, partial [Eubacterium sp.]|nr:phage Gp37/Gp68 family protein [Eubacterium sp.]
KCSPGCKNCYVFYLDSLRNKDANVITKSKTNFNMPLKKDRYGNFKLDTNKEVATCFTSDFFIEEADEWRGEAWEIIKQRNDIKFLICTKRIERFEICKPTDWGEGYNNVSLAVTCENQQKADERLPVFMRIKAKRKYIFASPLLEDIDFSKYLSSGEFDMVSVGGESYKFARECRFEWVKHIIADCDKYGVVF